jgi:tyrosinase
LVDWDWHLDAPDRGGSWLKSPLFDPITGFGSNGVKTNASRPKPPKLPAGFAPLEGVPFGFDGPFPPMSAGTGGGCLLDGPFKNITLTIGPMGRMTANNTRCLKRDLNPTVAEAGATRANLKTLLHKKTFNEFRRGMEMPMGFGGGLGGSLGGGEHSHSHNDANTSVSSPIMRPFDMHVIGHGGVGGEVSILT